MKRHYSPNTPVTLFEGDAPVTSPSKAIVFLKSESCTDSHHFALSKNGELEEVARNLYHQLQDLDQTAFEGIFLELPKNEGTGIAIRDRMHRAAAQ